MIQRWRTEFARTFILVVFVAVAGLAAGMMWASINAEASRQALVNITVSDYPGGKRVVDHQLGVVCYTVLGGGIWCEDRMDVKGGQ